MRAPNLTRRLFWAAEFVLLGCTVALAASISHPSEWQPIALVVVVAGFALLGQWFSVSTSAGVFNASLVAIVLAMALLGPAAAAACSVAGPILNSAQRRLPLAQWLNNITTFAVAPFVGGLVVLELFGHHRIVGQQSATESIVFGLIVLAALLVLLGVNFTLIALDVLVEEGRSLWRQVQELFLPLLPADLATGALATILAVGYRSVGLPLLFGSIALLLILRHLTVALLRSEERAEQLQARSTQLVGLQLGILRTLVRALGMRDESSGRHAAAVARYANALASELGCGESECDVARTAGLLHEIGKFTWPDRVLHAEAVAQEDIAIVKNHPQEGALLVGALDGYGEAADAILYHHERMDGAGYPAGLIGNEIPLASRILAICSAYDTMTARDGYRSPMTPGEGIVELRNGARNGQFDADLVEAFILVLEREGPRLAEDANFDTELEFERRVSEMAKPHPDGGMPQPPAKLSILRRR